MATRVITIDEFVFAPVEAPKIPKVAVPKGQRSHKRFLAGGVALLLVAAGAVFFVLRGPTGAAAIYTYSFNAGDERAYDFSAKMNMDAGDGQPFTGEMRGRMGFKVLNKMEDGSGIVELNMSGLTLSPAPAGMPAMDGGTLRLGIAPDGRISSANGTGGFMGAAGGALGSGGPTDAAGNQFLFPQFPADAIAPGDSWNETATIPVGTGQPITMNVKGTHNGFESTSYGEAAKLKHEVRFPLNVPVGDIAVTGSIEMVADSLVVQTTGDLVKMTGTIKMVMAMAGSSLNSTMDITVDRVT